MKPAGTKMNMDDESALPLTTLTTSRCLCRSCRKARYLLFLVDKMISWMLKTDVHSIPKGFRGIRGISRVSQLGLEGTTNYLLEKFNRKGTYYGSRRRKGLPFASEEKQEEKLCMQKELQEQRFDPQTELPFQE